MDNPPVSSKADQPVISLRVRLANGNRVMSKQHNHALGPGGPVHSPPTINSGSELDTDSFPETYKRVEIHSLLSSAAVQLTPILLSHLPNFRPGAVVIRSSPRHSISPCSPKLLSPSSPSGLSRSTP